MSQSHFEETRVNLRQGQDQRRRGHAKRVTRSHQARDKAVIGAQTRESKSQPILVVHLILSILDPSDIETTPERSKAKPIFSITFDSHVKIAPEFGSIVFKMTYPIQSQYENEYKRSIRDKCPQKNTLHVIHLSKTRAWFLLW